MLLNKLTVEVQKSGKSVSLEQSKSFMQEAGLRADFEGGRIRTVRERGGSAGATPVNTWRWQFSSVK